MFTVPDIVAAGVVDGLFTFKADLVVAGPISNVVAPIDEMSVSALAKRSATVIFLFTGDELKSIICSKSTDAAFCVDVNDVKAVIFLSAILSP